MKLIAYVYLAVAYLAVDGIAYSQTTSPVEKYQHLIVTPVSYSKAPTEVEATSEVSSTREFKEINLLAKANAELLVQQGLESAPLVLPKTFKAKAGGKSRWWGTHRFQIDSSKESQTSELNGKVLKESFWALRTIFSITDAGFSSSLGVAYNSWFFWRTFNVFNEHDQYVGQINKHWFTWFSGLHHYDIRNKEGKVLAVARIEDAGHFREIVMRSADKSYRYKQVVARFKVPREYNPYLDSNNDYLAWNVEIIDQDNIFFSKDRVDPRILSMFIPFVSSKDYNWK